MKKLDDDKVTYFDIDSITFMCECGNEISLMFSHDSCPICNREYLLTVKAEVHELEEDDEMRELEDEETD